MMVVFCFGLSVCSVFLIVDMWIVRLGECVLMCSLFWFVSLMW